MPFVAGQYTVSYGGSTVGQIEQGVTISHSFFKQPIVGDNFGQAIQDAVFLGADVTTDFRLMEWDALAAEDCFWPYGNYLDVNSVIGTLDVQSSIVKALLLTALPGTPARTKPTMITFQSAIIREGVSVSVLFDPRLRVVPISMRAYPEAANKYATLQTGA